MRIVNLIAVMLSPVIKLLRWRCLRLYRLKAVLLTVLTLLVPSVFAPSVLAHPHSWIDMKTYIQGADGMITGFKMEWSFDPMTSAYMLDGEDTSTGKEQETLSNISASILENMLYEHYFTYFYDVEEPIRYKVARSDKLTRDRAKLVLSFELPLAEPKALTRDSLRLLIFEPSYFVDMAWKSEEDVVLSPELANLCQLKMLEPNPTAEQMNYAMSLPIDADPDNALGQLFTQTVKIVCTEEAVN